MYTTLFFIIQIILLPFLIWQVILFFAGLFPWHRSSVSSNRPLRFAVITCARNEEGVIGNLLTSIQNQDYPVECQAMFLVAHNCTDNTAAVARQYGATVWELSQTENPCKGDALKYGIARLIAEYADQFDAVCFFDADNVAAPDFLTKIGAVLQQGYEGATGLRLSVNPHVSAISEMFAVHWMVMSAMYHAPRDRLGISTIVQGTGFAVTLKSLLPDGWQTSTLTEDFEFSVGQILKGYRFAHAPDACFFDEQPEDLDTWFSQLYRWMFGAKQGIRFLPRFIRLAYRTPIACWDLFWNVCVIPLFTIATLTLLVTLGVSFLATGQFPWTAVLTSLGLLLSFPFVLFMACLGTAFCGKRLRDYWRGILIFPLFIFSAVFFYFLAFPRKRCQWRTIRHRGSQT